MSIELGYEDLAASAPGAVKVPGAAAGAGEIAPLTGNFGERLVQGLQILNNVFSQWTQLSQNPDFKSLVLKRLNLPGAQGDQPPQDPALGIAPTASNSVIMTGDIMATVKGMGAGALRQFINTAGDKTVNEVLHTFGGVKLSQLLMMLRD